MECAKKNDIHGDSILPEPRNEAEHKELIKHAGTPKFWLGVVKGADKEWHYESNKEQVAYDAWGKDMPLSWNPRDTCVVVDPSRDGMLTSHNHTNIIVKGGWYDRQCEVAACGQYRVICEKKVPRQYQGIFFPIVSGGVSSANKSDTRVQNALNVAVFKINEQMNSLYLYKVADNSFTVTHQLVAGRKFHFQGVKFAQTNCVKNAGSDLDLASCQFSANGKSQTCSFDVVWQAWMTPQHTLWNLSCN